MNFIEKAIIKAVNDLKKGFDPKIKCSVRKIILKRYPNINKESLNNSLRELFCR